MVSREPRGPAVTLEEATFQTVSLVDPGRLGALRRFWRRLLRNRSAVIGLAIVALVTIMAVGAPLFAPHDPDDQFPTQRLAPPSREFLLGTDNLGRDNLSRVIYGARPSIGSAALATVFILAIGITIGAWAGYIGGIVDDIAMRVVDVFLAFPSLILALAIVGVLGPGLVNTLIAVTLVVWASYARLVRGIVLELRELAVRSRRHRPGRSPHHHHHPAHPAQHSLSGDRAGLPSDGVRRPHHRRAELPGAGH